MESYLYRIPPEQGPRVTVIGGFYRQIIRVR